MIPKPFILVIDNYDSFTWNLVHYLMELGAEVEVVRNDAMSAGEAISSGAQGFLISPGPCTPNEAGISLDLVGACADAQLPLLGVCLGHQSIGQYFGGKVVRGGLMHGKVSPVSHDGSGLFKGLPSPFVATRYHSLIVENTPDSLVVNATSDDAHVMGIRHRDLPIHGVQFHPESIATEHGHAMLANFLDICGIKTRAVAVNAAEAEHLFGRMLDGEIDDGTIAATLVDMAERGETAEEIAGAVLAMRARMKRISAPEGAIDVCGTGGDGQHSLNVSTAVALVVAACGVPVAKHGNRAASSLAGGADTLEALGLNLARASELAEQTLPDLGIAFLFAPAHHPALGRIAPIRKALGRRTIFNLLGPLANPAGVRRQLVGVAHPSLIALYRDAMRLLDTDAALIVSGAEGLDELSIAGTSYIAEIGLRGIASQIGPDDAGLTPHPLSELRGGDAEFNAEALRRLLMGAPGAYRDAVLLNSAAALIVAGVAGDWLEGIEEAAETLDKGLAKALLDCWVETVR